MFNSRWWNVFVAITDFLLFIIAMVYILVLMTTDRYVDGLMLLFLTELWHRRNE